MPLTEIQIKNAKPAGRPFKLADGGGLHLLVQPNGSRLWRMKYRFGGKEKLLSFGAYPAIGIAVARTRRAEAKAALEAGQDPAKSRPVQSDGARTFGKIAKLWHDNREGALNPAHAKRVWSRLERDVIPHLGAIDIDKITPPDVLEVIRKIEARGALDISRRAKQGIGQVFQFAIASGIATHDPTTHITGALKPRPRVRHMAKVAQSDLTSLFEKLRNYREEGKRRSERTSQALVLALLTWVRTSELRFARKSEFENLDGSDAVWRIPADRMKMAREHLIPLSVQAVAIVKAAMAGSDGEFVFPGDKPRLPMSENTMLYALYRLGYHSRQTVHGFRGLASTWANEQLVEVGEPPIWVRTYHEDWVETQLAHSEANEVRGAYNAAEYLAPRRRMLQHWADTLYGSTG